MKIFFSMFLFCKKNRMPFFNSCAVTQKKKKKKESNPFTVRHRRIHFRFESQCKFSVLRAGVSCRPWAGICSERQQSSVMAGGRFSLNCKNIWRAEAPLCSREGKKRLSFIIQMKWGPADGGRGAVGLRQKTSCSLPLWFKSARVEIKSSKGISDCDGSH